MDDYDSSYYDMEVKEFNNLLSVSKIVHSSCVSISINTNGRENGGIELRSKVMVEQLHFMLGQLLSK